jgi:hypothetical protein
MLCLTEFNLKKHSLCQKDIGFLHEQENETHEVKVMELVEIRHELEKMAKRLEDFRGSL